VPFVASHEAPPISGAVDLPALIAHQGVPPWRLPLVGTDAIRVVLLGWEPGFETVPHLHPRAEEVFQVLAGCASFRMGDDAEVIAGPGSFLVAPHGTRHAIRVIGDQPLVLLAAVAPNEDVSDEAIGPG
jgi:quercetin dioxygenase-like cupin family protein